MRKKDKMRSNKYKNKINDSCIKNNTKYCKLRF